MGGGGGGEAPFSGPTLNTAGIVFNCSGNSSITGDNGVTPGTFGLKINRSNIIVAKCPDIQQFVFNINVSADNNTLVDTKITGSASTGKDLWFNGSGNVTFINVSFTQDKVQVIGDGAVYAKYYINVTVNNTHGARVNGASVGVYNFTDNSSKLSGTTNAAGEAYFNVTARIFRNTSMQEFIYWFNATDGTEAYAENFTFNITNSSTFQRIVLTIGDVLYPKVTITSPENRSYGLANFPLVFNVTTHENSSVRYTLNGGKNNYTTTGNESLTYGTKFNGTNGSLAEGGYAFVVYANDSFGNMNMTKNVSFSVDLTRPNINITSPTAQTYTVNNYLINFSAHEDSTCRYTLDGGSTNTTLTSEGGLNRTFSETKNSVSNAAYTLTAYCNDTAGNTNYTSTVAFTVSVSSGDSGGGGGGGSSGGGTVTTPTPTADSEPDENESTPSCVNECSSAGVSCSGDRVQTCAMINGCMKLTASSCGFGNTCSEGICIEKNNTIIENIIEGVIEGVKSGASNTAKAVADIVENGNVPRPSDLINIPNVPPIVVDSAVGTVAVGAAAGAGWWIFVAIASSFLPLFVLKLRHYSVSVFDSNNELNMFKKGTLDRERLYDFLSVLEKHFGTLVFAAKDQEVVKYLSASGFIEVRLDDPFILTGHFSKGKDASVFAVALREILHKFGSRDANMFRAVERASIIGAWRAWRRERRTQKELEKIFAK